MKCIVCLEDVNGASVLGSGSGAGVWIQDGGRMIRIPSSRFGYGRVSPLYCCGSVCREKMLRGDMD